MFFKERGRSFHFVDLNERDLSPGEIENIIRKEGEENIIDKKGKYYLDNGYAYRDFDIRDEIQSHSQLLKTPIVRMDKEVVIGYDPKRWKELLD